MPKLAIAVLILVLAAVAGTISYAGYLVVGFVSSYLGTGRFVAGLLLGALFARLPYVRQGKLRTVGLLPKHARRPVLLALLAGCLLSFVSRGELIPSLFLGLSIGYLLAYKWMRQAFVNRALSSLFGSSSDPARPMNNDPTIIDVEVREKKD
ncbi:hypothetical protein [Noviherbaspirillum sp. Root189]|uniref:hypothetical protein n=1 Tax=Noviherbaspirillum sp. Root189 TaxID=1736487 RepID=UPI0012E3419B|nr:hypothetical protein [Noviherbaspirillum sp. Root189]